MFGIKYRQIGDRMALLRKEALDDDSSSREYSLRCS